MKKYTHLSYDERTLISYYHDNGKSRGEISRSKSTISKELSRNSNKSGYNAKTAGNRSLVRCQKPRRIDKIPALREYILNILHEGISPEMISIRPESIYRRLYDPSQNER